MEMLALGLELVVVVVRTLLDGVKILDEPDVKIDNEFSAVEILLGFVRLSDSINVMTADEFCAVEVSSIGVGLPETSEMIVEDKKISVVIVGSTKKE